MSLHVKHNKMKMVIVVIALLGLQSYRFVPSHEVDNLQLLAGTSQKSWYLYSKTPMVNIISCNANSPQSLDNTWIFFADGTFEFNRGVITKDANCTGSGCCADMLNVIGSWNFTNSGAGLRILSLHQKENPTNSFTDVLMNASLLELAVDRFKVTMTDTNDVAYTVEFRAR